MATRRTFVDTLKYMQVDEVGMGEIDIDDIAMYTEDNEGLPIPSGPDSARPTLGAGDVGVLRDSTDSAGLERWTGTEWVAVGGGGSLEEFQISYEKQGSTDGGSLSSAAPNIRFFNTVNINTIAGASIEIGVPSGEATQITLPAGTYKVTGACMAYQVYGNYIEIHDDTLDAVLAYGTGQHTPAPDTTNVAALIDEEFTIGTTTLISVLHWVKVSHSSGSGKFHGFSDRPSKFANMHFVKIA